MQAESYPPRLLTDLERGWVAELFEGEGYAILGTTKYTRKDGVDRQLRTGARVGVAMTDYDVMTRLNELWPTTNGLTTRHAKHVHWKTQYHWRLGRRDQIAVFLRDILSLLGVRRREQALRVLAYVEAPDGRTWRSLKTHCPQGHAYTSENTLVKRGSRHCRACARDYARRRRAEANAQRCAAPEVQDLMGYRTG